MLRNSILAVAFLVAGCGADVAGTAAITGAARAQEVRQARQTMDRVQQKLDAANQATQQRLEDADKAIGQQ